MDEVEYYLSAYGGHLISRVPRQLLLKEKPFPCVIALSFASHYKSLPLGGKGDHDSGGRSLRVAVCKSWIALSVTLCVPPPPRWEAGVVAFAVCGLKRLPPGGSCHGVTEGACVYHL